MPSSRKIALLALLILTPILLVSIYLLDRQVETLNQSKPGEYTYDGASSTIKVYARIKDIVIDGERVSAKIDLGAKSLDTLIFDKKNYATSYLVVSSDRNNLYDGNQQVYIINNAQRLYDKKQQYDGKVVELTYNLGESSIKCNDKLVNFLSSGKGLDCIPLATQLATYAK